MKALSITPCAFLALALLTQACSLQQRRVTAFSGSSGFYPSPTSTPVLSPAALEVTIHPEGASARMAAPSAFDPTPFISDPSCTPFPQIQPFGTLSCPDVSAATLVQCGYGGSQAMDARAWSEFGNGRILDWALVELRDSASPSTIVSRRAGFLMVDGRILDMDSTSPISFVGLASGSYRVLVRIPGYLAVVSQTAVSIQPGRTERLDLTDPSNLAGTPETHYKVVSGVAQMIAGDPSSSNEGSADGILDSSDLNYLSHAAGLYACGYSLGDLNFDGSVDNSDFQVFDNNRNATPAPESYELQL